MRIPHAAKTLKRQVLEARPKAKVQAEGEPDGLGVVRTLRFDKATSRWLDPLLTEARDPRVTEHRVTDAGYLHVTFSPRSVRADNPTEFDLDAAETVVTARQAPVHTEDEPEPEGSIPARVLGALHRTFE